MAPAHIPPRRRGGNPRVCPPSPLRGGGSLGRTNRPRPLFLLGPAPCAAPQAIWAKQKPMNDEELLFKQVQMTTAATKDATVWVYRCSVYAYPWYTSVRRASGAPIDL